MRQPPTIAVTSGDPCGIGPEVILKALSGRDPVQARVVIIGDHDVFAYTARRLKCPLPRWERLDPAASWPARRRTRVAFVDLAHHRQFLPGRTGSAAGGASLQYVKTALALWRAKRVDALVTAPVTKWAIERSGTPFSGHTEYLAAALHRRDVVMLFVSDTLRVALLTRHVPLRLVAAKVTPRVLRTSLLLTANVLRTQFGIRRPRIALCGLNPHAGEGGLMGQEERRLLPGLFRGLRGQGLSLEGPFAADALFADTRRFDLVVCWYHDQGLIPFKMLARDHGCQLTAGLPFVRTAPDHGTALDIAGRNRAHPGSMQYALALAARLARRASPSEC